MIGAIDSDRVELTEAALELVDSQPSSARGRLLANLAAEIAFGGDDQRRLVLSDAAEQMARSFNDGRLLAWVLNRTGYAAVLADAGGSARGARDRRPPGCPTPSVTPPNRC